MIALVRFAKHGGAAWPADAACRRPVHSENMHNLSDEVLCARWIDSPCYQYFCGELSSCVSPTWRSSSPSEPRHFSHRDRITLTLAYFRYSNLVTHEDIGHLRKWATNPTSGANSCTGLSLDSRLTRSARKRSTASLSLLEAGSRANPSSRVCSPSTQWYLKSQHAWD